MRNIGIIFVVGFLLASCASRPQNIATGAAIGAGTGCAIGSIAGACVPGALAGGAVGGVAGAFYNGPRLF